jgi:hypothetical protein
MPDSYPFEFDRLARIALAPAGIRPSTSFVRIADEQLTIRYGPWHLETPLSNVLGADVSGPYQWVKVVGPHLSLTDGGVTFGTNGTAGVCVRFRSPVPGLLPVDWLRHPGVTVTVAQPEALAARLALGTSG